MFRDLTPRAYLRPEQIKMKEMERLNRDLELKNKKKED
jgi:hypothetical protein